MPGLWSILSGLNCRGLFEFIFPQVDFLPDWVADCTAEWTRSSALQAVPALPSSVDEVPPRDSAVKSARNQTNKLWQEATCYLLGHSQHFCEVLSEIPHYQMIYSGKESSVVKDNQTRLQKKYLKTMFPFKCLCGLLLDGRLTRSICILHLLLVLFFFTLLLRKCLIPVPQVALT